MSEPIAQFNKNSNEEVRICLEEYRGHKLFDIRSYFHDGQEWRPTRKGISLKVDLFPELKKAMEMLEEALGRVGNDV